VARNGQTAVRRFLAGGRTAPVRDNRALLALLEASGTTAGGGGWSTDVTRLPSPTATFRRNLTRESTSIP
jgi:hypothetical protein